MSGHVLRPELALPDVCGAELPVLPRVVDALDEALALLLLRQLQEELDDACAVEVLVVLEIDDGTVAALQISCSRLLAGGQ